MSRMFLKAKRWNFNKRTICMLIAVLSIFFPSHSFAAGALMQAQRAKQMRAQAEAQAQQQAQMQAMQQQAAMQNQAEVQAAQQYMAQQQVLYLQEQISQYLQQQQLKQVEQALVMRYVQQELAQQMAQAQIQYVQHVRQEMMRQAMTVAVQRAMEERAMAERDVVAAKAYLEMRNQAIEQYQTQLAGAMRAKAEREAAMQRASKGEITSGVSGGVSVQDQTVRQIVGMQELLSKFDKNSKPWKLLIDMQAKVMVVNTYIERFRSEGVVIGKSPASYVEMIDGMSHQNAALLERPFKDLLQLLAIMEYDFDKGYNRDELARKVLGDELYQSNKKRLSR